jgi:hypothetical protein
LRYDKRAVFAAILVVGGAGIHFASLWWERAFATFAWSRTSPDGCIRVDTYEPFWVLPSYLHRVPDPDSMIRHPIGKLWGYPIFDRAYEASTGAFLGETIVYDSTASHDIMFWNEAKAPGRRIVLSHGFPLVDTDRCADESTLSNLRAIQEAEGKGYEVRRKQREAAVR